jgi:hypothetical protein
MEKEAAAAATVITNEHPVRRNRDAFMSIPEICRGT